MAGKYTKTLRATRLTPRTTCGVWPACVARLHASTRSESILVHCNVYNVATVYLRVPAHVFSYPAWLSSNPFILYRGGSSFCTVPTQHPVRPSGRLPVDFTFDLKQYLGGGCLFYLQTIFY
jgi:hypothetical protein